MENEKKLNAEQMAELTDEETEQATGGVTVVLPSEDKKSDAKEKNTAARGRFVF